MTEANQLEGQDLVTRAVDRLASGTHWEEVERDLKAAMADGRINSATADWAIRRTRVVAGKDRHKWQVWAKVVVYIHEDRRAGSWTDRFQERLGRKPRLGAALLELAQAQVDSGNPGEGAQTLGRAWAVLVKYGNVGQQGTCRYLQARCEASGDRWVECRRYAHDAGRLLTRAEMFLQAGRAQILAAEAELNLDNASAAKRAVRQAEDSARRADDFGRATLLVTLIDHFRRSGDLAEARRFAEPALAAAHASGRATLVAAAQESIGIVIAMQGDTPGGLEHLMRAADQFRAAGLADQALDAMVSAAQLAIAASELEQAEALLNQVKMDPMITGNPVLRARLLIGQGRVAHARGDEIGAAAKMQEAVALLTAAGFSPSAAGITIVGQSGKGHP